MSSTLDSAYGIHKADLQRLSSYADLKASDIRNPDTIKTVDLNVSSERKMRGQTNLRVEQKVDA